MLLLALPPSGSAAPALGLTSLFLMVSPSPSILVSSFLNQSCQVTSQETFPYQDRPQQTSGLEGPSMIMKPQILVETPVLEPGIDDLGSPVYFPIAGRVEENALLDPLVIFPGLQNLMIGLRLPVATSLVPI